MAVHTKRYSTRSMLVAALAVAALAAGCSSAQDAAQNAGNQAKDAAQNAAGQAQQGAQNAADQAKDAAGQAAGGVAQQIQGIVQTNPVTFTTQSAELTEQNTQTLQRIAAVLKASGATVTVDTHAGYPEADRSQQLSQQRADNIAKALTAAGVDASKIKTNPTGNTTAQGDEALKVQLSSS